LTDKIRESDNTGDTQVNTGGTQVKIVIPDDHSMVSLLGSRDELLTVIERLFAADVHVRGNEVTVTGAPAETALVERLFGELIQLVAGGAELTADSVERSVLMLRRKGGARPAEVLNVGILSSRGRTIRPKTPTPSSSGSARPAPGRPTWPWPRPSGRCRTRKSTGSS
jgi:phosphate starvation-inducible protein PhoH